MDELPVTYPGTFAANGATFDGACFAPGTLIATPFGHTAVEVLEPGNVVTNARGQAAQVRWVGVVSRVAAIAGEALAAVRIRAGALSEGIPFQDLTVTADHGIGIDGRVINASALVNGDTIDFVPLSELPNRLTYYHVETEAHDMILANGVPAETFLDMVGRRNFDNYDQYLDLHGTDRIIPEMRGSRIVAKRLLPETIRKRLGHDTAAQPDFSAIMDA